MTYLITFLEGIFSFLSPCMLPLLPVYLTYFAGNADKERGSGLPRTLAFVAGFTVSFLLLGLLFSAIGSLLRAHQTVVNILCGLVMIGFGLSYLGVFHLPQLTNEQSRVQVAGVFSAFLFGLLYPVYLTPCIGAFLGSALAMATASGSMVQGAILLLLYALGLGIPFVLSALIMSHLDVLFRKVKEHYDLVNRICGVFLIVVGLLMMLGIFDRLLNLLA